VLNQRSVSSFWNEGRTVERLCYVVGALLLVSGLVHLVILVGNGATWLGPLSLRKAMTFGLSFGLTLITIGWVSSFLAIREPTRTWLVGLFAVASVMETALVSMQAWRGVPSHFNMETTFDAVVARALAAGGFALVVILTTLTVLAFRRNPAAPAGMRLAIRSGFVILLGSMAAGALMIGKGLRLIFAGNAAAAYATAGTFKPVHGVMMHAILLLPLLAWLLMLTDWTEQAQRRLVLIAVAGYAFFAILVAIANLSGRI
jgi:hypothetical protein